MWLQVIGIRRDPRQLRLQRPSTADTFLAREIDHKGRDDALRSAADVRRLRKAARRLITKWQVVSGYELPCQTRGAYFSQLSKFGQLRAHIPHHSQRASFSYRLQQRPSQPDAFIP